MKNLIALILLAFGWIAGETRLCAQTNDFAASVAVEISPAFINELSEEMRTNNSALQAADALAAAADANANSIKTWDDPTLRVGVMAAERMMRREDGDLLYGVEQKLPLFGKPQAERRVAHNEHAVATSKAEARFQTLRRDLALALFATALVERSIEIIREDSLWLEVLQQSAERRYETGDATQFELLRIQNERARRLTELLTEQQMLEHQRVNLNRFLNRDMDAPWPSLRLPEVAQPVNFSAQLMELAVRYEPELQAIRNEIKTGQSAIAVARKERFPEIAVGAESRIYTGNGEFREAMVTLSMTFPWGNRGKYNAAIRREREKLIALQLNAHDTELGLRSEVHDLTVKIDTARREALLYRDEIIPRSEAALDSAQFAWEGGRGMFRDVLDARRMWLDAHMNYARAVTEQYQRLADLVLCCGLGDFEALIMIGALPDEEDKNEK